MRRLRCAHPFSRALPRRCCPPGSRHAGFQGNLRAQPLTELMTVAPGGCQHVPNKPPGSCFSSPGGEARLSGLGQSPLQGWCTHTLPDPGSLSFSNRRGGSGRLSPNSVCACFWPLPLTSTQGRKAGRRESPRRLNVVPKCQRSHLAQQPQFARQAAEQVLVQEGSDLPVGVCPPGLRWRAGHPCRPQGPCPTSRATPTGGLLQPKPASCGCATGSAAAAASGRLAQCTTAVPGHHQAQSVALTNESIHRLCGTASLCSWTNPQGRHHLCSKKHFPSRGVIKSIFGLLLPFLPGYQGRRKKSSCCLRWCPGL